jgi:hypothetical protein
MKAAKIAAVLILGALFAPGMQAQIRHVEMRVEGMT